MNIFTIDQKRIFITYLIISVIGLVMLYSSSYFYAKEVLHNGYFLLQKQMTFFLLGTSLIILMSYLEFEKLLSVAYYLNIFIISLMLLTLVPFFSIELKGAARWIKLGTFQFQPGEIVKISIIPAAAQYINIFKTRNWKQNLAYGTLFVIPLIIYLLQPDFGSCAIYASVMLFLCFLAPIKRKFFYIASAIIASGGGLAIFLEPYRLQRLLTFLDPWKDPRNSGFQIIQSYLAFAHGHIFGQGIGNSKEKLFYLPEAHNDFIFSVVGEELGLVGVLSIIFLYIYFFALGPKVAIKEADNVKKMVLASIFFTVGLQVVLNLGVVLGLLPTKGLNLPFISYGGSSFISNCIGIGIVMSCLSLVKRKNEIK